MVLESGISPLLALLMLVISLTFDAHAVKLVFRKPSRQLWALGLVYGPMSLAGWLTGRLFFGSGPLAAGQTLVGTLPTDVSAPLLVLLARGNVALAAVLNAVNTVLSPFIVPILFLLLTGIELQVPIGAIIMELVLIVVLPTVIGVYHARDTRKRSADTMASIPLLVRCSTCSCFWRSWVQTPKQSSAMAGSPS